MQIFRKSRLLVLLAVAASALVVWAVPAAQAAPAVSHRAGYTVATPSGSATADARVTVPTVTCSTQQTFAAAVVGPVMVTSNGNSGALVAIICSGALPSYVADIQINGVVTTFGDVVNPGDIISLHVSESAQSTSVTVSSITNGWTESLSGGGGAVTAAFVGTSVANCISNGACSTLDQLTTTRFRLVRVNNRPIGAPALHATASNIVSSTGIVEARTGRLALTRKAFTVRWVASCQPDPSTNRC